MTTSAFVPDYTHNSRNLNRFAEIPRDLTPGRRNAFDKLPEWKMRSINATNVKGYYWPKPLKDSVYRPKVGPHNENAKIVTWNAQSWIRDPRYYRRHSNIFFDRPGESPDEGILIPEALWPAKVPRPFGRKKFYYPTKEERSGERALDNYNVTSAPRSRNITIRAPWNKYTSPAKIRKNADNQSRVSRSFNIGDNVHKTPHHIWDNLQVDLTKDRILPDKNRQARANYGQIAVKNPGPSGILPEDGREISNETTIIDIARNRGLSLGAGSIRPEYKYGRLIMPDSRESTRDFVHGSPFVAGYYEQDRRKYRAAKQFRPAIAGEARAHRAPVYAQEVSARQLYDGRRAGKGVSYENRDDGGINRGRSWSHLYGLARKTSRVR